MKIIVILDNNVELYFNITDFEVYWNGVKKRV